jgi:uncharacterized membrane protein
MSSVEQHIDVGVPLAVAFDTWTRFERLPEILDAVEEVHQLDDTHLHGRVFHDGASAEWACEILEQRPDERIVWRSTSGITHGGVISFHRLDDRETRVMVMADVDAASVALVEGLVRDALGCFKRTLEGR